MSIFLHLSALSAWINVLQWNKLRGEGWGLTRFSVAPVLRFLHQTPTNQHYFYVAYSEG